MDVVWRENSSQNFQFPAKLFEEYSNLAIGSYIHVELSDKSQVIGRAFLSSTKNANFAKLSYLCSDLEWTKPKNNSQLKRFKPVKDSNLSLLFQLFCFS